MAISPERIREIEQATVRQAQNSLWHEERKNRLTASQFGRALTAYASLRDDKSSKKLEEIVVRTECATRHPGSGD